MLTFNEELHEYRWNGVVVPSVTTIIASLYDFSFVSEVNMEKACRRGTEVHRACELYDQGALNEDGMHLWAWIEYFNAYKRFRAETGFVPEVNEQRIYHPQLKYAGSLDLRGLLNDRPSIIDIKTTASLSPAIGVQLAGYEQGVVSEADYKGEKKYQRFALQLRPDGTYRLQPYTDQTDWSVFVGLLNAYNWKRKHNILKG